MNVNYFDIALAFFEQQKWKYARTFLEKAKEQGTSLARVQKYEQLIARIVPAPSELRRAMIAVQKNANDADLLTQLSHLYHQLEDAHQAWHFGKLALEADRHTPVYHYNMIVLCHAHKRPSEGLQHLQTYRQKYGANSSLDILEHSMLMDLGAYDKAIAFGKGKLDEGNNDPHLLNNQAFCYLKRKDYFNGLHYAQEAIAADPHLAYGYSNASFCWLQLGDLDQSEQAIRKSIQLDPSNAYAYKHLAHVYLNKGEMELMQASCDHARALYFDELYGFHKDERLPDEDVNRPIC